MMGVQCYELFGGIALEIHTFSYHLPHRYLSHRVVKTKKQNMHPFIVEYPLQSLIKQTLTTLNIYSLVQVINKSAHKCGHIIDWIVVLPDDDVHIKNLLLQT